MAYDLIERRMIIMSTVSVNFRLDSDVKQLMEKTCDELGLSMSAAFTIFAKKVAREKRVPFELAVDPFYSPTNLAHLQHEVSALNSGKGVEHELIDVD